MKSRSIFHHIITTFIVITLTSCSLLPIGNNEQDVSVITINVVIIW